MYRLVLDAPVGVIASLLAERIEGVLRMARTGCMRAM